MLLKTMAENTVTYAYANDNFSRVVELAETRGKVIILKDNRPRFLVIDLDSEPQIEMNDDERFEFVAARILREHRAAIEELAKW